MAEQLQFAFLASLDFPGRTATLRPDEVAAKLGCTARHIVGLIEEGKLAAVDLRGKGATRAAYRIPVEAYRDYVIYALTTPVERSRLLRDLPRATIRNLIGELQQFLAA